MDPPGQQADVPGPGCCGGTDCACARGAPRIRHLSEPGDVHERQAEAVADQVAHEPAGQVGRFAARSARPAAGSPIRRKHQSAEGMTGGMPSPVNEVLSSTGHPLSDQVRAFMEPRFGHDFSNVRVHSDDMAAAGAEAISARAFTHGDHIAFARGEYQPATVTGHQLLAHELTHVLQQASGAAGIDRAKHKVGNAEISIDYGDVVRHDSPAEHQSQVEARYTALTGEPALDISAAVAALTGTQRRWLLFALDLLSDNPLPGLDLGQAAGRLVRYAPSAAMEPLGASWREFATEAMRASGWLELALTAGLKKPGETTQEKLDAIYNPTALDYGGQAGSECPVSRPADRQLDEPTLRTDLGKLTRDLVAAQASAVRALGISVHDVSQIRPVADLVQAEALRFFAPYIGFSHTRGFQQTWDYSKHLTPSTSPGAIPAEATRGFLDNRARRDAESSGLLAQVHYDPRCPADELVFGDIIDHLAADASVRADVGTIMSWQSFTASTGDSAEVTMNMQYSSSDGTCDARWRAIETLCHELMHVYASQEFYDLHKNRLLIKEGVPEVLGDQLYDHIRKTAKGNPPYRRQFEDGLPPGACTDEIPPSTLGYRDVGKAAERIRRLVGDDGFRAAYFLGQTRLAGLQPKLRLGDAGDPLERQADTVAARVLAAAPAQKVAPTRRPDAGGVVQRQPAVPSPQDRATVEQARARLKVLEPMLAKLQGSQVAIEADRLRVLADRQALDAGSAEPASSVKQKQEREGSNWSGLNLAPVTIAMNADAIVVSVRFHVRFEDPAMKGRFAELQSTLNAGVDLVWKKKLEGVFAGRTFTVVPELTLVDAAAPRDRKFWLITVRTVSTGVAVTYPGCTLDQPDPHVPTSVTDSTCDGGVMSIPPAHITNAGVLGHELLHLFGLIDRYMLLSQQGTTQFMLVPTRETHGRPDPLGGEDGTILREDLGYLLDKLGVYKRESQRQAPALGIVETEVRRLRRIVELGYDPDSLVRTIPPKDFNDKVIKSAEDL
jgi:Domain of unknown function (DUF4157)